MGRRVHWATAAFWMAACALSAGGDEPPGGPWFRDAAEECGLATIDGARNKWVDLSGDGIPDLLCLRAVGTEKDNIRYLRAEVGADGRRRFVDETAASGINVDRKGDKRGRITTVLLAGDVDNDGDVDLYCGVYCNFEQPKVNAQTHRIEVDAAGKPVMTEADHGGRSEILLNDGHGRFSIAPDSGVGNHTETVCAATFVDCDRDGVLDLFVGAWYRAYGVSYECYPDRLYHGLGDGRFEEVTAKAGLMTVAEPGRANSSRPTYGVSAADWNDDGWPDLLVCSYGRQWNRLWRNNGDGTFTDVAPETTFDGDAVRADPAHGEPPFRCNGNTFDCPSIDFDNDGDLDVFLAEITHSWAGPSADRSTLLVNQGKEKGYAFVRDEHRGIDRAHDGPDWNQGDIHAGWLDADNDGLPDLLLASSDYPDKQILRLFHQKADHTFEDWTAQAGLDWMNCTQISLADYDRDGDVDIVLGTSNMRLTAEQQKGRKLQEALWRNEIGNRNAWLGVILVGKGVGGANRGAVGARVRVTAGGATQTRQVMSSQGHAGHQDAPELLFGLGSTQTADAVEVRWPDREGKVVVLKAVPTRHYIMVEEGKEGWSEVKW